MYNYCRIGATVTAMRAVPPGEGAERRPDHSRYFATMADDLGFLLARVNAQSVHAVNGMIRPLGLSVRSYVVLRLAASEDPPLQRELAELLELDPSQVVALVHRLEADGLVVRRQTARDRRRNHVVATPAGRELVVPVRAALEAALTNAFSALSASELEAMRDSLLKLLATGMGRAEPARRSSKGGSVGRRTPECEH